MDRLIERLIERSRGGIKRERFESGRTPGMAPPGTGFIMVYMPSPPELEESVSVNMCRAFRFRRKDKRKRKKQIQKNVVISKVRSCVS